MNLPDFICPPRKQELARLRTECSEAELNLRLQFEGMKHCVRPGTVLDATREHPFAAMAIAAAGGCLAWELLSIKKLRGGVRLAFSSLASSLMAGFADPPEE